MVCFRERRIGQYSSRHKILLVGEGDFSFAASLARAFGSASNITATSLDSRGKVMEAYAEGKKNLEDLESRGGRAIHGVDAHDMNHHRQLSGLRFDRIVFNFPHAGDTYYTCTVARSEQDINYIERHRHLVGGFLKAARRMVGVKGEIHVTHKTNYPYAMWGIVDLAENAGLVLKREDEFRSESYPGYVNKKGYGTSWDSDFRVGDCSTYVFCRIRPSSRVWSRLSS